MMKHLFVRISAVVISVIVMTAGASAQRQYEPKLYLGGKAGATFSSMQFSPHVKQALVQGVTAGMTVRYTEENIFGLIGEVCITQRGWKEGFEKEDGPLKYDRKLTYITLPVLCHIYFGSSKVKGFVNLGPSVSYMLSSSISSNFDYLNPDTGPDSPFHYRETEQMALPVKNKMDYGILGGAGVEFVIARRHSIMLEGRYYFGLGSIFSSKKRDPFSASRCTSIEVSLGYMFRVK